MNSNTPTSARTQPATTTSVAHVITTTDVDFGGGDIVLGGAGDDVLIGGSRDDAIDGRAGSDLIFGDEVSLAMRFDDITNPRFQTLAGGLMYSRTDVPHGVPAQAPPPSNAIADLLFESGTAEVLPEILPLLSRVAEVIRRAPPNLEIIRVSGHTDDRPMHSDRYPSNWELSSARASAVARALIEEFSLDAERFVVSAHAHHRPRDGSTDPVAHARNRRVEIFLSPAEAGVVAAR